MPRKKKDNPISHKHNVEHPTSEMPIEIKEEQSKDSSNKEPSPKFHEEQKKQFYWAIGVMVALLVVFFGAYYWFKVPHTFNYEGLKFTPEDYGGIPVFHYTYSFTDDSGKPYNYNLYLREDPRKNKVPYEGEVEYPNNRKVYIAVNTSGLEECSKLTLAVGSLSMFIANNQIEVKGAVPDKSLAENNNQTFANCSSHPKNPVIYIFAGGESKVQRENNCYKISVAQCEVLPAVEKFILRSVIDARNYAHANPQSQQTQPATVKVPVPANMTISSDITTNNRTNFLLNISKN